MRIADLELDDLVDALRAERSKWISAAPNEGRGPTDAERVTICLLAAMEQVLCNARERSTDRETGR